MSAPEIDVTQAKRIHEAGGAVFLDTRDPDSFRAGHIPGAQRLHDGNVAQFVASADKARPVIVVCYHGNMSKDAAAFLLSQGFQTVHSMSGGFEGWKSEGGKVQRGLPQAPGNAAPKAGVEVSPEALAALRDFLSGEPAGTAVRLVVDPRGFGLALDAPGAGDRSFELGGVPFLTEAGLASALEGLKIGYQAGPQSGFTISGGRAPEPPAARGRDEIKAEIEQLIAAHTVLIFMKGTADAPRCGFSARAVDVLRSLGRPFHAQNVLLEPDYRDVLSELSSWPTIPQIFVAGKLIGGCDIVTEMAQSGELAPLVEAAFAPAT